MRRSISGFTIVELLIVIVIIAILAAISIVSYVGVQASAQDAKRLQDASSIQKALELYKIEHGRYPAAQASPGINGWEVSLDPNFLTSLGSVASALPTDPKNSRDPAHYYSYYRYTAGSNGCPSSAGAYYVLVLIGLEATDGRDISNVGSVCPGMTGSSRTPSATQAVFVGYED